MSSSQTLNFENARALSNLYVGKTALLKKAEEELGVKITSRDSWLKVEGTKKGVESTKELFRQLHLAHQNGIRIREHEYNYALKAVSTGKGEELEQLWAYRVTLSPKKAPLTPKTFSQMAYLEDIKNYDLTFGIGAAGTGKTFLAMAMAVAALRTEQISRIILTRPAVEAGEALGYLPGDLQEKIFPYLRPLYDALYDMMDMEEIQKAMDRGVIEIAPLAYMRGRTLANAFVILDEAQNTTTEQMFMFLTRLGQNSKCVVTGDPTQVDLPHSKKSGLVEAVQALHGVPGIGMIKFEEIDIVRHPLVAAIVDAYKMHRGVKTTSMTL
ncbi:MAG: PhoH family protein [Candidatus Methylacidiphilales bacterium]|nr:PhoH family protein [Candidatus Methylacidiphilales bacterium]